MNIDKIIHSLGKKFLVTCLPVLIPLSVIADETEIFYQQEASRVNANVLFVLDASGSMDTELSDSGGKTRMQVMKEAFREVMEEAPSNLNVGLMGYANAELLQSYQWDSVKGVNFPVSEIDADASEIIGDYSSVDNLPDPGAGTPVRTFLADVVDSWQPSGYTPIVDSLYEAARYFRGESAVWGRFPPSYLWAAHPSSYSGDLSCGSSTQAECRLEWGECNGTEASCETRPVDSCCNWVDNDDGSFCENEDYSCSINISHCQHTVCGNVSGTAQYETPIEYGCQSNYLVLMSDGKPEYPYYFARTDDGTGQYAKSADPEYVHDTYLVPNLAPPIDGSIITTDIPALISSNCVDKPQGYASGTCGPELVNFLASHDQNSDIEDDQTVETYTVAFGLADEPAGTNYLASLATAEDGAFTADNADELAEAFRSVFQDIEKKSLSFSSPSFSVSEDSLLSNGSDVYVPVFNSKSTPLWSGNLRKFRLSPEGEIVGKGGSEALTNTGSFTETAQDLWSADAHGVDVKSGGAADKLPDPVDRKLQTDAIGTALHEVSSATSSSIITTEMMSSGSTRRTGYHLSYAWGGFGTASGMVYGVGPFTADNGQGYANYGYYYNCDGQRIAVINRLVKVEEVTTCAEGELVNEEQRKTLLDFARGYDLTEFGEVGSGSVEARKHMGDTLNTKPVVVNYDGNKSLVFFATNEGYIHAIDTDTGIEEWAFMPSDLLKNQKTFFEDNEAKHHVYGLDGPLTLWNYDADNDGDIVSHPDTGEGRYLFFGMRRGGNMYYALDISNPGAPRVAWKISPDDVNGAEFLGYSNLGETWSKPTLSRMRIKKDGSAIGEVKHVLVFGGGYDPKIDEQVKSQRGSDPFLGADVFIVDALSGKRLWSLKASDETDGPVTEVTDSIPGDIRVLDMDNNGELDRLYFGDTGGNIWRVDMKSSISNGVFDIQPSLTHFAELGGSGDGTTEDGDNRKFFYEPDTALRLDKGKPILTVSIGSGYRTHPLDLGDNDRFYVLIDGDVYNDRSSGTPAIRETDLLPRPEGGFNESILDNEQENKGWYLDLAHKGEKVLATSLTFLDKIIFTTFAQADENNLDTSVGPCEPLVTTSRAYILDLLTGRPVANLDRLEEIDDEGNKIIVKDGFVVAGFGEILDSPQLIFSKLTDDNGGECQLGNCQQSVSIRIGKLEVPILDTSNASTLEGGAGASGGGYNEAVDLTKLLPRLYWRDDDVSGSTALVGEENVGTE